MRNFTAIIGSTTLALVTACGGTANAPNGEHEASAGPATFSEQVERGATVFGAKCSTCHGKAGEGSADAPALVGATAFPLDPPSGARVRKTQFVTVADVADFVVKNMPPNAAGSLSADDYFCVLAFDLKANGIDLGEQKLDSALAATLTIPRH